MASVSRRIRRNLIGGFASGVGFTSARKTKKTNKLGRRELQPDVVARAYGVDLHHARILLHGTTLYSPEEARNLREARAV